MFERVVPAAMLTWADDASPPTSVRLLIDCVLPIGLIGPLAPKRVFGTPKPKKMPVLVAVAGCEIVIEVELTIDAIVVPAGIPVPLTNIPTLRSVVGRDRLTIV